MELVKCLNCSRCVTAGTAFCIKHVVAGVGRPFGVCSVGDCGLPCRGSSQCVLHLGNGIARSAFEEDVLMLHKKKLLKAKLAKLGIARSQNAGSDGEEDADVAVPSWRVHLQSSTGSPMLLAHLEEEDGLVFEGSRQAKLRKVEKMYELQVARLEDMLRACDNQPTAETHMYASIRPIGVAEVGEPRVPDVMMELAQREAGLATCKRKGCTSLTIGPSPYCVAHVMDDAKQTLFTACAVCKTSTLRTLNPGSETCPNHTPPPPPMIGKTK